MRSPKSSPTEIGDAVGELIVDLRRQLTASGRDTGPDTIRWHLSEHHNIEVSMSTIRRRLVAASLVTPRRTC